MKSEQLAVHPVPESPVTSTVASLAEPNLAANFSERIRLLIQRVGSATEIARMCGFSEGVVRSWRDGNSDPSRARCVTLAKTLGISLVWLVAGEGTIQPEARSSAGEGTTTSEVKRSSEEGFVEAGSSTVTAARPQASLDRQLGDSQRLEAAKRILQSGLELSGVELTPADHVEMLISLYEIVGPSGTQIDAAALLAFNQRLAARVHTSARMA